MTSSLLVVQQVAEALAERYLSAYTDVVRKTREGGLRRKEINDALWGTITLTPLEVAIVDSPLLQRLRFLHQAGAAHWVYPGAVHTRFEHALGALYQTEQLISTLNTLERHERNEQVELIKPAEAQMLRLCALFSNVGHLAFSRATVSALDSLLAFSSLPRDFSEGPSQALRGDDPTFSQILAFYIVRAPATREFLSVANKACKHPLRIDTTKGDEDNIALVIEKISWALIGRKVDEHRPLLHELISGPFSAGKLDALIRDSRAAGIPSVFDIRRLLQKLSVLRLLAENLPVDIAGTLAVDPKDHVWLFGVRGSATAVLNELQLARILTATKIDQHPKVLAIEQMLQVVIQAISRLTDARSLIEFLYTHAEDAFLGLDESALLRWLRPEANEESTSNGAGGRIKVVAATLLAIRERRLWVRAFQLSSPSLPYGNQESSGLAKFREDICHVQRGRSVIAAIREGIVRTLRAANDFATTDIELDSMLDVHVVRSISAETQIGRALIIQGGVPYRLSETWQGQGSWVEQYMHGQPSAYVFSAEHIADATYICIEQQVRLTYDARLPPDSVDASKREKIVLKAYKESLSLDYWRGIPYDLRPRKKRLGSPDVLRRVENIAMRLAAVHHAQHGHAPERTGADPTNNIYEWLQQFPTEDDVDCALHLLDSFKVLARADTRDAFSKFFEEHPGFISAFVVAFGEAKDSSTLQAYFSVDQKGKGVLLSGTLDDYLKSDSNEPLIFVDDFIGSGSQASDILAAWFGRDDLRKKDLEESRRPLSPDMLAKLRKSKIAFLFVAAWSDGIKALQKILVQLDLQAVIYCHIDEKQIPFAKTSLLKAGCGESKIDGFLSRCEEIGAELIRSKPRVEPLEEAKVLERALGYGRKAMLLASPVNVPTQTLTAIWMEGKVDGTLWKPLLPRRQKT